VKVLAEIPARPSAELRPGSLRRGELDAYGGLLERLDGARCVLVTGNGPGIRSAAIGLAATAAANGLRAALLECDVGDPHLADELGLANVPGLHEYVRGAAEVESILKPVVLAGPGSAAAVEPLVCVVAGRPATDAWALLSSERCRQAIQGLRSDYELVVIAGPPLGDEYALREVLGSADATVFCVGAGEAARKPPIPVTGLVVVN